MTDPELEVLLRKEDEFYLNVIDLIAASNAPGRSVRCNADWGVAQFRSAEGHIGKKPYAGTLNFDSVEQLTAKRACALFGSEHANVQPLSGTFANFAAQRATMKPGDTMLSLALQSGGHLSHGHPKNVVSDLYRVVHYTVDRDSGLLDYDAIEEIAHREKPKLIVAGFSAYPRAVNFTRFSQIAKDVGAYLLADLSHIAGLVVTGLHENPCALPQTITTTSVEKTLRGTRGGILLCRKEMANALDGAIFPGLQSSVGLAGLVSVASTLREAATPEFKEYQQRVVSNARAMANTLAADGFKLVTGGTDTHMLILDLTATGLSGREAEGRLSELGILSNRNLIPFDPRKPFEASGLRLGTPTITARGYDSADVEELAGIISNTLRSNWRSDEVRRLRQRTTRLRNKPRNNDTIRDLAQSFEAAVGAA